MDESLGKIRDKIMDDEQIVELFWNRKENAIEETPAAAKSCFLKLED